MRRLILKNGKEIYTWDENQKGDNESIDVVPAPVDSVVDTNTTPVKPDVVEGVAPPIHVPTTPEEIIEEIISPDLE